MPLEEQWNPRSIPFFIQRTLIVVAVAGIAILFWRLGDVLILAFGGVLLATILRALSARLAAHSPLSDRWALPVVVLAIILVLAALSWFVGERITTQASELWQTLPQAIGNARQWLAGSPLGRGLLRSLSSFGENRNSLSHLAGFASTTFGALADVVLIAFLGLYLAGEPGLYRSGFLRLLPTDARASVGEAIDASGSALRLWLLGQFFSMVVIGAVTGAGLALLGMPLALTLGLLAGLLEFVPFVGPIAAAVPAVLVAFTQGPREAVEVIVFYLVLHQAEGNLLMPLVQKWAVSLPPALSVLSVIVFAILFGPLGILFATPLMVVVMTLVDRLYVRKLDGNGEDGG